PRPRAEDRRVNPRLSLHPSVQQAVPRWVASPSSEKSVTGPVRAAHRRRRNGGSELSAAFPNLGLVSRAARGIWPDDSPTTCHPARCQCQERPWRSTMRRLPSLSPDLLEVRHGQSASAVGGGSASPASPPGAPVGEAPPHRLTCPSTRSPRTGRCSAWWVPNGPRTALGSFMAPRSTNHQDRSLSADRTAKSSPSRGWTAQGMFSTALASTSPSSRPVGSARKDRHRSLSSVKETGGCKTRGHQVAQCLRLQGDKVTLVHSGVAPVLPCGLL